MTATLPPSSGTDTAADATVDVAVTPAATHRLIGRLAGVTMPAGGALMLLSTVFDPPSVEPEPRGMFVAYGADRAGADVAATILHYGMALFGVGLLLAALAMATRRGRALAVTGGILGALGFVNMSGAVFSDWYDAYLASAFGPDKAMEVANAASDMPWLGMGWMLPAVAGCVLGPILLGIGLARGRVVGWWVVALPVAMGAMFAVSKQLGPVGFAATLVLGVAFGVLVGLGLRRHAVAD